VACLWPMQKICKVQGAFDKNMELLNPSLTLVRCAQTLTLSCIFSTLQPLLRTNRQGCGTLRYLCAHSSLSESPHTFVGTACQGLGRDFKMMYILFIWFHISRNGHQMLLCIRVTLCFIPYLLCFRPLSSPSVVSVK
jgi:hypothetical protein